MFDNPNEELKKLEQQLLAVEETEEDFDAMYQELLREYGPGTGAAPSKPNPPAKKNSGNPVYTDHAKKPSAKKGRKKKKKSLRGLVITLCLECAGIAAVILWWILRIL